MNYFMLERERFKQKKICMWGWSINDVLVLRGSLSVVRYSSTAYTDGGLEFKFALSGSHLLMNPVKVLTANFKKYCLK
jgi:hypothetical protein